MLSMVASDSAVKGEMPLAQLQQHSHSASSWNSLSGPCGLWPSDIIVISTSNGASATHIIDCTIDVMLVEDLVSLTEMSAELTFSGKEMPVVSGPYTLVSCCMSCPNELLHGYWGGALLGKAISKMKSELSVARIITWSRKIEEALRASAAKTSFFCLVPW